MLIGRQPRLRALRTPSWPSQCLLPPHQGHFRRQESLLCLLPPQQVRRTAQLLRRARATPRPMLPCTVSTLRSSFDFHTDWILRSHTLVHFHFPSLVYFISDTQRFDNRTTFLSPCAIYRA
ncbi:hypothetical protein OG21DRAFT_1136152 [Imleria badia]|nr:hypothetical protein OG21DRAFT_1136152 [Imleria badia]